MTFKRILLSLCGILVIGYALSVLLIVQLAPDMDLRTVFSNDLRRRPLEFDDPKLSTGDPRGEFQPNDKIIKIGDDRTTGEGPNQQTAWAEVLKAPRELSKTKPLKDYQTSNKPYPADAPPWPRWIQIRNENNQVVDPHKTEWREDFTVWIEVTLQHPETDTQPARQYTAWCRLGQVPLRDLVPSILWFFLKTTLLLVGAWVWWKRPDEPAVEQFYLMCLVTMAAYIGGYHWTLLTTQPVLLVVFIICGTLLPAVNLHFYLVFPRPKAWLAKRPRLVLSLIYGIPLAFTAVILYDYLQIRWPKLFLVSHDPAVVLNDLKAVVYGYFGSAAIWYVGTVAALVHSYFTLEDPSERNQARTVLLGASLALVPIFYSLYLAFFDIPTFSEGGATWPMFAASAILSVAMAVSVTRYGLIELDKFLSSSMDYFVASFLAAVLYYAIVFAGTLLFNRYVSGPRFFDAVFFSATALVLLLVLDQLRGRVRKFLDRRFAKQKTQLDRTLQRMGQAIEQLVDPHSLAVKFLNATTELLGASQGAIFMRQGDPPVYRITGFQGSAPSVGELTVGAPLVDELVHGKTIVARLKPYEPLTLAQRQLRNLGGEVAQPIVHEDSLLAFLVLGPKDPPYRPEDEELLAAFAQITGLALQSAEGHRTIEQLNIELRGKVQKISEQQRRILALQSQLTRQVAPAKVSEAIVDLSGAPPTPVTGPAVAGIVGGSSEVHHLLDMVRKVAVTDATVLLRGESGTGKELLARAVHEASPRADKAFVKVHCTALSPTLLESELFGHVKGAFTGAHKDKVGRFEMAHGGTLFLDEIGDISLDVQTKLLRVLQERTLERVGSSDPIQVDVRIITATHQNLENLIRQTKFREDLFYRLNVFPVQVPPLRQRSNDIPALATHFLRQSAQKCKKDITSIDEEAMALLKSYSWPGNIRQLENVIERAVVIAETSSLTIAELPAELFQYADEDSSDSYDDFDEPTVTRPISPLRRERLRSEREELVRAMAAAHGNKSEAARALGVARSTLVSRLKKFGLV